MGQQQLLLLVLGIVIVGIAVVAGIQAFSEGKTKAARDAATSDAMRLISDVQAWKLKPAAFGGGASADNDDFQNVSFASLGVKDTSDAGLYVTINGCFELSSSADDSTVTVYENPNADSSDCENRIAAVVIEGTNGDDIRWEY